MSTPTSSPSPAQTAQSVNGFGQEGEAVSQAQEPEGSFNGCPVRESTPTEKPLPKDLFTRFKEALQFIKSQLHTFVQVTSESFFQCRSSFAKSVRGHLFENLLKNIKETKNLLTEKKQELEADGLKEQCDALMQACEKALENNLAENTHGEFLKNYAVFQIGRALVKVTNYKTKLLEKELLYKKLSLEENYKKLINTCDTLLVTFPQETISASSSLKDLQTTHRKIEKKRKELFANIIDLKNKQLSEVGAYRVSASTAARRRIHQPEDAIRPYREPESYPEAEGTFIPVAEPASEEESLSAMEDRVVDGENYPEAEVTLIDSPSVEVPADQVFDIRGRLIAVVPHTNAGGESALI